MFVSRLRFKLKCGGLPLRIFICAYLEWRKLECLNLAACAGESPGVTSKHPRQIPASSCSAFHRPENLHHEFHNR